MNLFTILLFPLTFPLSLLYGTVIYVRHWMFDKGVFRSVSFDIPVLSVGNITVGGTGKTPHIEYLIELLRTRKKIAVLSRGYKRKTKGFRYVQLDDTARDAGDEPLQIKRKYPEITVVTDARREEAIVKLKKEHPEIDLILLDDGFQYRKVIPQINVVLIDYNRPVWNDFFLPLGRLRDARFRLKKADILVITKCPPELFINEKTKLIQKLAPQVSQKVYFTCFESGDLVPLFSSSRLFDEDSRVLAIAGIARPEPFFYEVKRRFLQVESIRFPDHYSFNRSDLDKLEKLSHKVDIIITTEKDSVRFLNLELSSTFKSKLYYIPIKVKIL